MGEDIINAVVADVREAINNNEGLQETYDLRLFNNKYTLNVDLDVETTTIPGSVGMWLADSAPSIFQSEEVQFEMLAGDERLTERSYQETGEYFLEQELRIMAVAGHKWYLGNEDGRQMW